MQPLAVITGTTHGIGRVIATGVARAGFDLMLLCRNVSLGREQAAELAALNPQATIQVVRCDLVDLRCVREAALTIRRHPTLPSLLILNAGVAAVPAQRTGAGMDLNFAVNHLGHFLLAELLREHLAPRARVITVASRAHYRGTLQLDTVAEPWESIGARASYARSKLANVLFSHALARRFEGTQVAVNCVHPGIVATNLLPWWVQLIQRIRHGGQVRDAAAGAHSTLRVALGEEFASARGHYFDEHARAVPASALARDTTLQETLWQRSLAWVAPHLDDNTATA